MHSRDTMSAASSDGFENVLILESVEEVHQDPIEQFAYNLGQVINVFGPDTTEKIKLAMCEDRLNMEKLRQMEETLRREGDWEAAQTVCRHARDTSEKAVFELIPLRSHLKEIAERLYELTEDGVMQDQDVTAEVLAEIKNEFEHAFVRASTGLEMYKTLATDMAMIQNQYIQKKVDAEREVHNCEKLVTKYEGEARNHSRHAIVEGLVSASTGACSTGGTAAGLHAAVFGANVVSKLPMLGGLLTTTTTTSATVSAGGISGLFGGTTTVLTTAVSWNPVGLAVGAGFTVIFGVMAAHQFLAAQDSSLNAKTMSDEAKSQLDKKETSISISTKADALATNANDMTYMADFQKDMWLGVYLSAEEASKAFARLQGMNQSRRGVFNQRMRAYGAHLLNFIKATDEYMFFLSKSNYLPLNFDLRSSIGLASYDRMQNAIRDAPRAD